MPDETTRADEGATLADIRIGQPVFDEDGTELGSIRGVDEHGFYVRSVDETGDLPVTDARDVFGKAFVMWRCWECGEMGEIETDLPAACPNCNAPREELYYWAED